MSFVQAIDIVGCHPVAGGGTAFSRVEQLTAPTDEKRGIIKDMGDYIERQCTRCGSHLHHESDYRCPPVYMGQMVDGLRAELAGALGDVRMLSKARDEALMGYDALEGENEILRGQIEDIEAEASKKAERRSFVVRTYSWGNRDRALLNVQALAPALVGRLLIRDESDAQLLLREVTNGELALFVRAAGQFMAIEEVSGG